MPIHESDILRRLRLIDWLKAELVTNVGQMYHTLAKSGEQPVGEAIASVVITCYVLARRLGIDFSALEDAIITKLGQNIKREHEAEKWYGDLSEYQRYLRKRGE